jgi:hypothetical protein
MDLFELQSKIDDLVEKYMNSEDVKQVNSKDIGLDPRCYGLSVNLSDRTIIVRKSADRDLQYYGGFEYAKEARSELGDYVFYSGEQSGRVEDHLSQLEGSEENEEESA